ncbi:unnamed protein product, partial [marine sediment metagenome]
MANSSEHRASNKEKSILSERKMDTRLRIMCRKAWGFESPLPHCQILSPLVLLLKYLENPFFCLSPSVKLQVGYASSDLP